VAFDPFHIEDPDGLLHTLGLIEEDADWTDCGREIVGVAGWAAAFCEDLRAPRCEGCLDLLHHHVTITNEDIELIAENSGLPLERVIDAHNGGRPRK
jgi:hypothetical protein